eukprot:gene5948-6187_t
MAMRSSVMLGSGSSTFSGRNIAFKSTVNSTLARAAVVSVEAKRVCQLTGKKRNKANVVTFSNKHNRKWQEPNLQHKKIYWEAGKRWVKLRISTTAIKSIQKNGLEVMAKDAGIDLWKLPFEDARPERLQYLAENKGKVPVAVNPRAMKNKAKIAASKKQPRYPVYEEGGRIVTAAGVSALSPEQACTQLPVDLAMGQAISGGLTQRDVDDVIDSCNGAWSQPEVESLYKRFRSLDRGRKGYISAEELMGIPELSINPLAQRLVSKFGLVTYDDMQIMLRQLAGSSISDDDINALVRRALQEAGSPEGLSLKDFRSVLTPHDLVGMVVEVPTEL